MNDQQVIDCLNGSIGSDLFASPESCPPEPFKDILQEMAKQIEILRLESLELEDKGEIGKAQEYWDKANELCFALNGYLPSIARRACASMGMSGGG